MTESMHGPGDNKTATPDQWLDREMLGVAYVYEIDLRQLHSAGV